MDNYEQKYKEALGRASHIKDDSMVATPQEVAEYLFPELRESEDERIRKWIVDELKTCRGEHTLDGHKEFADKDSEAIAWLEKQKEQKAIPSPPPCWESAIQEQKPVEWSEEDEKNIYFLTRLIELYIKDGRYETGDGTVTKPEIIKMLKSLRPQKKEDLPRWKKWYNGACGNCNNIPIALVKVGCSYALTDCLGITGQEYIMLSDLEKLPKEDGK